MREMLLIFDRDEAYVKRLSSALNRRSDCPFEVRTVSDPEDLKRLSMEGRVRFLLLGEGAEEKAFDRTLAGKTVHLSALREDQDVNGEATIYKYQPVGGLLRDLSALQDASKEEEAGTGPAAVPASGLIGVASPVGRCGKTAFSLTLARLLGEGKKVLSLDLEAFSGLGGIYGKTFRYGLSDLLYAERVGLSVWKEGGEEPEDFIQSRWGLDMAVPADDPEVIFETPPGEIVRAAERLLASRSYDAAVLDLGSEYRLIREFLPKLGKLYVPTLKDSLSQAKTEVFLNWVRKASGKRELPVETLFLPDGLQSPEGGDPVEALLFGEMGGYVRKLLSMET